MDRLHSEKLVECTLCDFKTNHGVNLKNHINKIHENIKYSCDICGNKIANISNLYQHKRKKHKMVDFKPSGRQGRTKQAQKTETYFQCDLCKRQFSRAHNLKRHKKINCGLNTDERVDKIIQMNTIEVDTRVMGNSDIHDMFLLSLLLLLIAMVFYNISPRKEVPDKKRKMSNYSTEHNSQERSRKGKFRNNVSKNQLSEEIKQMLESLNKNVSYTLLRKEIQREGGNLKSNVANDEIYFPKYFCFKFIDDQVLVPPSEGVDVSVDVGASPVHVGNHVKSMQLPLDEGRAGGQQEYQCTLIADCSYYQQHKM